jgi:hypothetical protein
LAGLAWEVDPRPATDPANAVGRVAIQRDDEGNVIAYGWAEDVQTDDDGFEVGTPDAVKMASAWASALEARQQVVEARSPEGRRFWRGEARKEQRRAAAFARRAHRLVLERVTARRAPQGPRARRTRRATGGARSTKRGSDPPLPPGRDGSGRLVAHTRVGGRWAT